MNDKTTFPSFVACAFCLVCLTSALAQEQDTSTLRPKLESKMQRVVVFKDGYCLIVKEATGTTDDEGNVVTNDVPDAAVLGSFWAIPQDGKLKSMVSGWVTEEEQESVETEASETIELIEANIGKTCSVSIGEKTKLSGEILKVLGPKRVNAVDASLFGDDPFESRRRATAVERPTSTKFLLRTQAGDVLIDASRVTLLTIDNMATKITRKATQKSRTKQLRFEFDQPNKEVTLTVMYFRPGIRWIPTYRVDLAENAIKAKDGRDTAQLTLQGEILNEAEDLIDVPIDIVVGVPNFRFKKVASPLILERVLRNALAQAAPQVMSQQRMGNNIAMSNNYLSNGSNPASMSAYGADGSEPGSSTPDLPTELTTKSGNDLFLYNLPKMSLRKGDRASIPILTANVPYRDVHTWDVAVKHSEVVPTSRRGSPLVTVENTVWRQIELINTSNLPWTTGAAMMVDGFQPLAQELLTYTPAGSAVRIPVTVAVDVRGQVRDAEVKRELDALRFSKTSYSKVNGQIEASITNRKPKPIDIEISLRFGGKADTVSNDGRSRTISFQSRDWNNYRGDPAVNNSTTVNWKETIEAGKSFEPKINYHFFSRN